MDKNTFIEIAKNYFDNIRKDRKFTSEMPEFTPELPEAYEFVNPKGPYPHGFVLACLMDRQVKAEKAWTLPYRMNSILGGFTMDLLSRLTEGDYIRIFKENSLHRFNDTMAKVFHSAVQRIQNNYHGNASLIWSNTQNAGDVVFRFMEFEGAGIKISTMAANILYREYDVPFIDLSCIDISPDVHAVRVMKRLGLIAKEDKELCIMTAKKLNPSFPGLFDILLWEVGNQFCDAKVPKCAECLLKDVCPKKY